MMNEKFKEELNLPATRIPMKDYCMQLAIKHVREDVGVVCEPLHMCRERGKYVNMLAIAKLEEAWKKVTARVPQIRTALACLEILTHTNLELPAPTFA